MGEFAPLRTGQLVVRHQSATTPRVLLYVGVLSALVLYGAFELGRYRAGYDALTAERSQRALQQQIESLGSEVEALRSEVTSARVVRDVNQRSYADVEKSLTDLQAQVLRQQEELAFYRGIVSPEDGVIGLRVQRFQVLPAGAPRRFRLQLVLVQAMSQDAVARGSVKLTVIGMREQQALQLSLRDLRVGTASGEAIAFSFRYFQNLEEEIELPPDFQPNDVEIHVQTPGRNGMRQSFPWRVQTEV